MSAAYASTASEWLRTIRTLPVGAELAFWQPTPAEPKRIEVGERWYFKERGQPLVRGFGLFKRWETGTLGDLFRRYGPATGYRSAEDFIQGIRPFREDASLATLVGNVVLSDFKEFDPPKPLSSLGLDDLTIRFRYIDGDDPLASEGLTAAAAAPSATTGAAGVEGGGPTTGIVPSDWTRTIGQSADERAFVYGLRFGNRNIWKVGWAVHVGKRLKLINDHIPVEVIQEQWKLVYEEPMPSKRQAFAAEQRLLMMLQRWRTRGERVNCTEKEFAAAWLSTVATMRADPGSRPSEAANAATLRAPRQ